MNAVNLKQQRAHAALLNFVNDPQQLLAALRQAGLDLVDARADEMACRWVPTTETAVPPDADTIIRTITTTDSAGSRSSTFWLAGLRGPTVRV